MCMSCWEEFGSPIERSPAIDVAAEAIIALDTEHPAGGLLHIVTDDWNLDDDDVAYCEQRMTEEGADREEWQSLNALRTLTPRERAAALYWARYGSRPGDVIGQCTAPAPYSCKVFFVGEVPTSEESE